MFDTTQAAAQLGISARHLRRYMRNNPEVAHIGTAGRYTFDEESIEHIRNTMPRRKMGDPPELAWLNQTPGFSPQDLNDPRKKQAVLEQRRDRQRRLNERLKELALTGEVVSR